MSDLGTTTASRDEEAGWPSGPRFQILDARTPSLDHEPGHVGLQGIPGEEIDPLHRRSSLVTFLLVRIHEDLLLPTGIGTDQRHNARIMA